MLQDEGAAADERSRQSDLCGQPTVMEVTDLHKSFRLRRHQVSTLKERALHPLRRSPVDTLDAVDDVSFSVRRGEFFGVIGRNGSGKSTLLKLLAGIYRPDSGSVRVEGRVSPFIELGVGFNPDLTALDNVVVNATLLGISRAEAIRRFDEIIEFAELQDFVDLKLKNYSSGMQVRLGFATAIQVDADVLLLDEVLAVGDAVFQEKCFDVFRKLKQQGKTIVLVTHDLDAVERFCDRAALLREGRIEAIGDPAEIVHAYQRKSAQEAGQDVWGETNRWGDGAAEVTDAWFEDGSGNRSTMINQGDRVTFAAEVSFHRTMEEPVLGVSIRNEDGQNAFVTNTLWAEVTTGTCRAGEKMQLRVHFENWLSVGRYLASPAVAHQEQARIADWREHMVVINVDGHRVTGGTADLPHDIEVTEA